ncbi:hypothetical protein PG5_01200 [Pseudomonas sp. G5(2012)]|nr:hypothetical protein PG5_01200 [Pseudomonas sp. G5(2012)]
MSGHADDKILDGGISRKEQHGAQDQVIVMLKPAGTAKRNAWSSLTSAARRRHDKLLFIGSLHQALISRKPRP